MTEENLIASFQKNLLSGSYSLESFVLNTLLKIEIEDEHINSFANVYRDSALIKAKEIDAKISSNQKLGKLFGAIFSIKDNLCYENHPASASSKILQGFQPVYSATAVKRLIDEDAIIIGSTNCDEFGMGSTNENSYYGSVSNPLDRSKVAGGSSGGAAASVAAGFCHAALGSDTGGSVRQPASFCGVAALKPTYGKISRYGLMAYASSFDQIGVISKSIIDLELILNVLSGEDGFDSTVSLETEKNEGSSGKPIAFLRSGNESQEASASMNELQRMLNTMNIHFENIQFKYHDYLVPTYYIIAMAEASSNLSRYDGVHFGIRSDNNNELEELYTKTRSEGFGDEVKRRIMTGTFVLNAGYYEAYYKKAQKVRTLIIQEIEDIFNKCDFIINPACNHTAFVKGDKKDPVSVYQSDVYTVLANICGLPAICLPLFKDKTEMPFGIQVHGRKFEEPGLLNLGSKLLESYQEPYLLN